MATVQEQEAALSIARNAHTQWRERGQLQKDAKAALLIAQKKRREQIKTLRLEIETAEADFAGVWRIRKEQLRDASDAAALTCLELGVTAHRLLGELGSRDVAWAYSLKESGRKNTLGTQAINSVLADHPSLEGVSWEYHEHTGVHGVLRSSKGHYKFYDLTGDNVYCIVGSNLEFITGDKGFYDSKPKGELERLQGTLDAILDGSYTRPIRLEHTKFRN